MRWSNLRAAALLAALSAFTTFPVHSSASDLSVGPLHRVAGGGIGEGAEALAVGLQPTSVLPTAAGLLIADEQFNRVRVIDANGRIHTVAGTSAYGYNGDGLPARDSHLRIVVDLAEDRQGRTYMADLGNRQIRILETDGTLRTFVDSEHPLFSTIEGDFAPYSVAVGVDGKVHVADRGQNVVWQFDPDGRGRRVAGNGSRGTAGDGAPSALGQLADPWAVAVGPDGAMWIADTGNRRLRYVSPEGRLGTAAGDGTGLGTGIKPVDVAVSADGSSVYVLDGADRRILRLGPQVHFDDGQLAGASKLTEVHRFAETDSPVSIEVDAAGALYVSDRSRRQVVRIDAAGERVLAGNGTARASGDGTDAQNAALYGPTGMAFASDGTLFFADRLNHLLRRINADGTISSLEGLPLRSPSAIQFDAQGRAYVADTGNERVLRIDADGVVTVVAGPGSDAPLSRPVALAIETDGDLLIADSGHRLIRHLDVAGTLSTIAGNGLTQPLTDGALATSAALVQPVDVAVDGRGTIWIADAGSHRVLRLGADGLLRVVAGNGLAGVAADGGLARLSPLDTPSGVEPDGAGGVLIADSGNERIVHVDTDGVLRLVFDTGVGQPTDILKTPAGNVLFADQRTHRILGATFARQIEPVAQRVVTSGLWSAEARAALPTPALQGLTAHPRDGHTLVTSRSAVATVDDAGRRRQILGAEARQFSATPITAEGFGAALLLVAAPGQGQAKPMTLVRLLDDDHVERFDLGFLFAGADAIVSTGGDAYLYLPGRLLRLRQERLLNIPGFSGAVGGQGIGPDGLEIYADLPQEQAALTAVPDGTIYLALKGSRDVIRIRDLNGDGRARGALEQERFARLPEPPVALAVSAGALYAATEANRVLRVTDDGVDEIARGFAPLLLDMMGTDAGQLLILEGDHSTGRLVSLRPARPELRVSSPIVDLGIGSLGEASHSTVILRNDGAVPVRAVALADEGITIGVTEVDLQPGQSREIDVTWSPSSPGRIQSDVVWQTEAGDELLRLPLTMHVAAPRATVEAAFDFGVTWIGRSQRERVTLRNEGDAPLAVTRLELLDASGRPLADGNHVSAGGFEATVPAQAVAAGATLHLPVQLTPIRSERYAAMLRVYTNDPRQPVHDIQLRGSGGRAQLQADPLDLGAQRVRVQGLHQLELRNTGDLDLRIHRMITGTRELIALTPRLIIPAGETRTVRFNFEPAAHGDVDGELTLWTNDPVNPTQTVPYKGRGVSTSVDVSAAAHDFGAVSSPVRWSVDVSNLGNRRLRVLEATTGHGAFRIVEWPRSIDPHETASVVVEFRPTGAPARAELLLRTDRVDAPEIAVLLTGRRRLAEAVEFTWRPSDVALWPDETLDLPLSIRSAAGVRGAELTLHTSAGLRLQSVRFPTDGLLSVSGNPLAVSQSIDPERMSIGLSLTGTDQAVSGDGALAVLRLRADGASLPDRVTVRLAEIVVRSSDGVADTLAPSAVLDVALRWRGDIDGDGHVGLSDVFALIDALDVGEPTPDLDLNDDGLLDRADLEALIAHMPLSARPAALAGVVPDNVELGVPYPNPFNSETVVNWSMPAAGYAELSIFNLIGQRVRTLHDGSALAGRHQVVWHGVDDGGHTVRSGVYFVVLTTSGQRLTQRLLLIR